MDDSKPRVLPLLLVASALTLVVTVVRFVELNAKKIGQTIHGVPVIHPDALPDDGAHVLSCVAAKGARDDIRAFLRARGLVELRDFTCLA